MSHINLVTFHFCVPSVHAWTWKSDKHVWKELQEHFLFHILFLQQNQMIINLSCCFSECLVCDDCQCNMSMHNRCQCMWSNYAQGQKSKINKAFRAFNVCCLVLPDASVYPQPWLCFLKVEEREIQRWNQVHAIVHGLPFSCDFFLDIPHII